MHKSTGSIAAWILCAIALLGPSASGAAVLTFEVPLSGAQEVPPNASTAVGAITGTYDDVTNTLSFQLNFTGLTGTTTAAHFHGPATPGANAPIAIPFAGFPVGVPSGSYANSFVLTAAQEIELLADLWYVNVHTNVFPGGEIRGQLQEGGATSFEITLSGSQEVPSNPSTGLGGLTATYTDATNTLAFQLDFTGLLSPTTAAHFHAPAAPGANAPIVIAFTGFPLGVMQGAYSNSFVLTAEQEGWLFSGQMYVNVHTNASPGGEIRGQLTQGTLPVELLGFEVAAAAGTDSGGCHAALVDTSPPSSRTTVPGAPATGSARRP